MTDKQQQRLKVFLISILLLVGLALIFLEGLDLLGYEGQPVNRYDFPLPDMLEIKEDMILGQTFLAPRDGLYRIDVILRNYGRRNTHDVTFYLKQSLDSSDIIYQKTFNASEVRDNQWRTFEFPPIPDSAGKTFFFYFSSTDSTTGNAITVGFGPGDFYNGGSAYVRLVPAKGDIAFRTYYGLSYKEKLSILGERLIEDKPSIWGDIRFYLLLLALYGLILLRVFVELIRLIQRDDIN